MYIPTKYNKYNVASSAYKKDWSKYLVKDQVEIYVILLKKRNWSAKDILFNRRSEHDQMRTMLVQLSSTTTDARVFYSIATVS